MESQPACAFRFSMFGGLHMKNAAVILAALIILSAGEVEAARLQIDSEQSFVEQRSVLPPRLREPLFPPHRAPRKDYLPRKPFRPIPRYQPSKPKPSNDIRGGKHKYFKPPQPPHK